MQKSNTAVPPFGEAFLYGSGKKKNPHRLEGGDSIVKHQLHHELAHL